VITGVAFVPSTPLLLEELSVDADEALEHLRLSSLTAVQAVIETDPQVVLITCAGDATGAFRSPVSSSFAGFGVNIEVSIPIATAGVQVPWTAGIALHLLNQAGYDGEVAVVTVAKSDIELATTLLAAPIKSASRCALIVVADGSAGRSLKAPGYLIDGAEEFDTRVVQAIATADTRALEGLDVLEGDRVQAGGVGVWKAVGAAVQGDFAPQLLLDEAPLGVGYFVATWLPLA
jgi:hypothetical protein